MTWDPAEKGISVPNQTTVDWPDRGFGFVPPPFSAATTIARDDLAFSIARNIAKATLRPTVLNALVNNAVNLLDALFDRRAPNLVSLPDVDDLGDYALNSFAHDVAVGVAGLLMEEQDFVWRAHAKDVLPLAQRPDYVWAHPSVQSGVVLSEVKGMAGSSRSFGSLMTRVRNAFRDQIDPWKLDYTLSGDPIIGGYAVGVHVAHSRPAMVTAIRSVPVTSTTPVSRSARGTRAPSLAVARSHYGAAAALLGFGGMARRIVGLPAQRAPSVRFAIVEIADMSFVVRAKDKRSKQPAMELKAFMAASQLEGPQPLTEKFAESHYEFPVYSRGIRADMRALPDLLSFAPDGLALISRQGKLRHPSGWGEWTPHSDIFLSI